MLFTVTGTFSDFAAAYEQYDCMAPTDALAAFLLGAESLNAYDQAALAAAAEADGHRIIRVEGGMHGLWVWHLLVRIEHDEVALYGGCIVQTDSASPA